MVTPPAPAPAVDPTREVSGGQDTIEAVAGRELPADAGETATPVAEPDDGFFGRSFGWLLRLAFLF